ncbi:unnamed protein product [Protopolystoma xenopodis]|uniref:Uncharacterized protein n=1 Tax=Protopolystoma xenopodis TaxID=117903 RepID=A0A3S5BLZ7_9PLAT|nr:unnamed protein product [Protopolystoma xenopodis]
MARLTDNADYDAGETSANAPSKRSEAGNYDSYYSRGRRARYVQLNLSDNTSKLRKREYDPAVIRDYYPLPYMQTRYQMPLRRAIKNHWTHFWRSSDYPSSIERNKSSWGAHSLAMNHSKPQASMGSSGAVDDSSLLIPSREIENKT